MGDITGLFYFVPAEVFGCIPRLVRVPHQFALIGLLGCLLVSLRVFVWGPFFSFVACWLATPCDC